MAANLNSGLAFNYSISVHLVISPLTHVQSLILEPHIADPMSFVVFEVALVLEEIASELRIALDFPIQVAARDVSEVSPCLLTFAVELEILHVPIVD